MEKSNKNSEKRKGIEKQIPAALTTNNPLERYTRGTGILLVALSIIGFFMLWPIYLPPLLSIGGAALILTKKFQKEPFVENKPLTKGGLLGKKSEKTIMRAEMKTLGIAESKSKIAPEKVVTFRSVAWP